MEKEEVLYPVVSTSSEGWQKRLAGLVNRRESFVLKGDDEFLAEVEESLKNSSLKRLIELLLLGGGGTPSSLKVDGDRLKTLLSLPLFSREPGLVSKVVLLLTSGAFLETGMSGVVAAALDLLNSGVLTERVNGGLLFNFS